MEGNSGDGRICHSSSLCTVARMAGLMWHNKSQNSLVRRAVGLERLNEAARVCSKHTHTQISLNGSMNSWFFSDVISRCGYTTKRLILLYTKAFFIFYSFIPCLIRPSKIHTAIPALLLQFILGKVRMRGFGPQMTPYAFWHVQEKPDICCFSMPSGRSVSICKLTNMANCNHANAHSNLFSGRGESSA